MFLFDATKDNTALTQVNNFYSLKTAGQQAPYGKTNGLFSIKNSPALTSGLVGVFSSLSACFTVAGFCGLQTIGILTISETAVCCQAMAAVFDSVTALSRASDGCTNICDAVNAVGGNNQPCVCTSVPNVCPAAQCISVRPTLVCEAGIFALSMGQHHFLRSLSNGQHHLQQPWWLHSVCATLDGLGHNAS